MELDRSVEVELSVPMSCAENKRIVLASTIASKVRYQHCELLEKR